MAEGRRVSRRIGGRGEDVREEEGRICGKAVNKGDRDASGCLYSNPRTNTASQVLDRFTDRGTVAMGKVESGTVIKGQTVMIMPLKVSERVSQCVSECLNE